MPEMQGFRRHVRDQLPRLPGTAPATSLNTNQTALAPKLSTTKRPKREPLQLGPQ